jgi:hypothetical protein
MCYTFGLGAVPKAVTRNLGLVGSIQGVMVCRTGRSIAKHQILPSCCLLKAHMGSENHTQTSCQGWLALLVNLGDEGGDVKRVQNRILSKPH